MQISVFELLIIRNYQLEFLHQVSHGGNSYSRKTLSLEYNLFVSYRRNPDVCLLYFDITRLSNTSFFFDNTCLSRSEKIPINRGGLFFLRPNPDRPKDRKMLLVTDLGFQTRNSPQLQG